MTRLRAQWAVGALLVGIGLGAPCWAHADTLIQRDGDHYKPGLAKTWRAEGSVVVFELQDGADGGKVAQALMERLGPGATASFTEGKLKVAGMPLEALLEQLVNLNIAGDDPLAMMGGLGGAVASASAEGGGSIRASRPTDMPAGLLADNPNQVAPMTDPNRTEMLEADVVEVRRGPFPQVTLKLKIRRPALAQGWFKTLHRGKIIEGEVQYFGGSGALDLQHDINRRNLGAFYLAVGDKVTLHAVAGTPESGGRVNVDWIERH